MLRTPVSPKGNIAEPDPQGQWAEFYAKVCEQRDLTAEQVDPGCARLITRRQAMQFHILPIRWDEGHLEVATVREHLERAAGFCLQTLTRSCRMVLVDPDRLDELLNRFCQPA